jgi:hypothetical protein
MELKITMIYVTRGKTKQPCRRILLKPLTLALSDRRGNAFVLRRAGWSNTHIAYLKRFEQIVHKRNADPFVAQAPLLLESRG